ncbi:MAG: FG-GAP repeat protein [Myxococcota bacterium]
MAWVLACRDPKPAAPPPVDSGGDSVTVPPVVATAETGFELPPQWTFPHDTGPDVVPTGTTGDTGGVPIDTGPPPEPAPPCDHQPITRQVRLTGGDIGDWAGRWVDAADVDGDGCDEVVTSEPAFGVIHPPYSPITTAVYLVQDATVDGLLSDLAFATLEGIGGIDSWGAPLRLLPQSGQVALGGRDGDLSMFFHSVPSLGDIVPYSAVLGTIEAHDLGFPSSSAAECHDSLGPAVCVGSIHAEPGLSDWSGKVWAYDAPVESAVDVYDARATVAGDPGDRAELLVADADIDGDGVNDLVIGGYAHDGVGKVGVLLSLPDGDHALWDLADATLTGEALGASLGVGLAVGDLDGDGLGDVMAGAPFETGGGAAYVFYAPTTGDHPTSTADVAVRGSESWQWLGYDGAIGDVDGDGAADLSVGAPWSVYTGPEPGRVLVYTAVGPGELDDTQATITVVSGSTEPDAFGMAIEGGDFDGDGLYDLVVGAPVDPTGNVEAGSITLVYGASL